MFGDSILDVLELSTNQLTILYNEATRQRWLMAHMERVAHYAKANDFSTGYQNAMKIHGQYTEGFYKKEREKLKQKLGAPKK